MLGSRFSALTLAALCSFDSAYGAQIPLVPDTSTTEVRPRNLTGRFLQVTDFHPDPFYKVYSSTAKDAACHRGDGPAGVYGAEMTDCDAPIALINATFDWIADNLRDEIDFVVWTGDSARHDNDEEIPRSMQQVVQLNELLVAKFVEVFGKSEDHDEDPTNDLVVPVVPTFGNNDILPHNIFEKAPNRWTRNYEGIWRNLIPEEQRHQFDLGGWFSVEVIPSHLSVFSLNSLYFFDSNSAVDGCASKHEPGYRQLEWLRIQLEFLRQRNMKAIIIGHVPPARTGSKQSWDETCWQKYALWMHQYRDVVTGSLYGHMNTDHFMLQDFEDVDEDVRDGIEMGVKKSSGAKSMDKDVGIQVKPDYLIELRDAWAKLPKKPKENKSKAWSIGSTIEAGIKKLLGADGTNGASDKEPEEVDASSKKSKSSGKDKKKKKHPRKKPGDMSKYLEEIGGIFGERFSMSHVAPSVVPNYFPTIRVYEYNVTGIVAAPPRIKSTEARISTEPLVAWEDIEDSVDAIDEPVSVQRKKTKKRKFTVPKPPSKSTPPGPAYSPQSLSLLGFKQYYANLTRINNDFVSASGRANNEKELVASGKWRDGKHKDKKPHDDDHHPRPKKFEYELLYDTRNDTVYKMKDMTMRSYIDLATRIGNFRPAKGEVGALANADELEYQEESNADEEKDQPSLKWLKEKKAHGKTGKDKKDKKKKKKKEHKKHKTEKRNQVWFTFARRAYVNTMSPEEVEDQFSH